MTEFNKVILAGHIGNTPELKQSAQGKPYLKLSVATHSFKPVGDGEKATYWHKVVVFGPQAELCATHLRKGSPILVEGSLEVRAWTDKEGKKVNTVSILAQRIQFMGNRARAELSQDEEAEETVAA